MMSTRNVKDNKSKIINGLQEGKTISQISRELFNTNSTARINALIDSYGLNLAEYSDRYLYMNREWLSEQLQVKTVGEVAKEFNMPRTSVTRYAIRFGLHENKFTRNVKNSINESYFNDINCANKAYWLGLIMADGNIYHYKDSDKVQFSVKLQSSDIGILEDFARDIDFPVDKIRIRETNRLETKTESVEIRSYNRKFCDSLSVYGIVDRKSGHEIFPKQIPNEFKKDFIRGFWDGDGTVSNTDMKVCSMSLDIICSISQWFCRLGIHYSIHVENNMILLKVSKKSWIDFIDIIYYPGCLGLQRKVLEANKIRSTLLATEDVNGG